MSLFAWLMFSAWIVYCLIVVVGLFRIPRDRNQR